MISDARDVLWNEVWNLSDELQITAVTQKRSASSNKSFTNDA